MMPAIVWLLVGLPGLEPNTGDGGPLSVGDLGAYQAALLGKDSRPATVVGFRDLWEHPKAYEGRKVHIAGKVERLFRQGAYGTFPPLVEAWVVSPSGDPFCVVFPKGESELPRPGGSVRFAGVFLRRIRYQGADGPRLAPLIVGPEPPERTGPAPAKTAATTRGFTPLDWSIGIVAALFVTSVMIWQHLRKPLARPARHADDPRLWLEEQAESQGASLAEGEPATDPDAGRMGV